MKEGSIWVVLSCSNDIEIKSANRLFISKLMSCYGQSMKAIRKRSHIHVTVLNIHLTAPVGQVWPQNLTGVKIYNLIVQRAKMGLISTITTSDRRYYLIAEGRHHTVHLMRCTILTSSLSCLIERLESSSSIFSLTTLCHFWIADVHWDRNDACFWSNSCTIYREE